MSPYVFSNCEKLDFLVLDHDQCGGGDELWDFCFFLGGVYYHYYMEDQKMGAMEDRKNGGRRCMSQSDPGAIQNVNLDSQPHSGMTEKMRGVFLAPSLMDIFGFHHHYHNYYHHHPVDIIGIY